jgi:hypothetical protein
MPDLTVLPVKKLPDPTGATKGKRKRPKLDPRLPGATDDGGFRPFLLIISAPVRSGKTNLLMALLYQDDLLRDVFDEIMYISPTIENDATGWPAMKDAEVVKITENLDQIDLILESIVEIQKAKDDDERDHTLIVLGDCLGLIRTSGHSYFSTLCSKYRHWKISIIVTTQNFRAIPITARYNASHYIIFKTNNRKELDKMEEELDGNFPFLEAYAEATEKRYNFLFLDMEEIKAYKNFNQLIYEKK